MTFLGGKYHHLQCIYTSIVGDIVVSEDINIWVKCQQGNRVCEGTVSQGIAGQLLSSVGTRGDGYRAGMVWGCY